ncbi:MAG: HK97 family phage prohead protease [Pseudomonadota bacterium]
MTISLEPPLLIEGYAALFGVADLSGDVVRAGAFGRTLRRGRATPMLLQHRAGAVVGRWTRLAEDGRGLYARGLIETPLARSLARRGLDGLSIGFRPALWKARTEGGRDLIDLDLVEVSLVAAPMQPKARFALLGGERAAAA